jgi:hypothetical protein
MMVLVLNISLALSPTGCGGDLQEAGNDFVFFRIFLLGEAFFLPLLFMMVSVIISEASRPC